MANEETPNEETPNEETPNEETPNESIPETPAPTENEQSKFEKLIEDIKTKPFKENPLVQGSAVIVFPFSLAAIVKLFLESSGVTGSAASFWTIITAIIIGVVLLFIIYVLPILRRLLLRITIILLITLNLFLGGWLMWVESSTLPNLTIDNARLNKFVESVNAPNVETLKGWSEKISLDVLNCQRQNKTDAQCVAEAFRNNKMPPISTSNVSEKLANEIMAGTLLLKNKIIADVLNTKLGVKASFLGTGRSLPQGSENFSDARLPEYFVDNLGEGREEIFTWILEPKNNHLNRPVKCLIVQCDSNNVAVEPVSPSQSPTPSNKAADQKSKTIYQENLKTIAKEFLRDDTPILIRFNQFPAARYKGTLGREESSKVFMCRLKDVWDMKLREAIVLSGHKIDDTKVEEAVFVWIYNPSNNELSKQATWENILSHSEWLFESK